MRDVFTIHEIKEGQYTARHTLEIKAGVEAVFERDGFGSIEDAALGILAHRFHERTVVGVVWYQEVAHEGYERWCGAIGSDRGEITHDARHNGWGCRRTLRRLGIDLCRAADESPLDRPPLVTFDDAASICVGLLDSVLAEYQTEGHEAVRRQALRDALAACTRAIDDLTASH